MKKSMIALIGMSLCTAAAIAAEETNASQTQAPKTEEQTPAPQAQPPSPEEVRQVVSYFLGFRTGQQFSQIGPLEMDDLDTTVLLQGISAGLKEQPADEYVKKDLSAVMAAFSQKMTERNAVLVKKNQELSKKTAEENAKKEGVKSLPSGVQYRELAQADGEKFDQKKHGTNASVSISYQLRLADGTVVQETEEAVEMPLTGMLPSIAEAMKLIPVGAEWELFIPSNQGYGEQGPGPLSAAAPFFFKVKLHEIKPAGTPDHPIQLTPEMLQQMQEAGLQPVDSSAADK